MMETQLWTHKLLVTHEAHSDALGTQRYEGEGRESSSKCIIFIVCSTELALGMNEVIEEKENLESFVVVFLLFLIIIILLCFNEHYRLITYKTLF